jgi:uncharacterized caspase-like protein
MRKALVVGIDQYDHISALSGCVNDAKGVATMLERNGDIDSTVNFGVEIVTSDRVSLSRRELKDAAIELFKDDSEVALVYFAGHGFVDGTGGFLCAQDCRDGDDGFALNELVTIAAGSSARNKVIILDSCHSGIAGNRPTVQGVAEITEGMTILTASTENQYAVEVDGGGAGLFTSLLIDALAGGAANLVGDVTPGSVYAHIDQSLGPWAQRPVFKTNVKTFVTL